MGHSHFLGVGCFFSIVPIEEGSKVESQPTLHPDLSKAWALSCFACSWQALAQAGNAPPRLKVLKSVKNLPEGELSPGRRGTNLASYSLVVFQLSSLALGDKAILPESIISPNTILSVSPCPRHGLWSLDFPFLQLSRAISSSTPSDWAALQNQDILFYFFLSPRKHVEWRTPQAAWQGWALSRQEGEGGPVVLQGATGQGSVLGLLQHRVRGVGEGREKSP